MFERRLEHMLDEVDADDDQREKVEAIFQRTAPQMTALGKQVHALRDELKQALLAQSVDRARIDAAKQKLQSLTGQLADAALTGLTDAAEILTPAQRAQIAEKIARFHH
jgi:Spy/CpxP family protein refolding chaperone